MMSSRRATAIALRFLAAGAVAVVIGLWMSGSTPSATVTCDGQVMGPGDTCISTSDSHNGTYEQLVQRNRESSASTAAAGPTVAVLGGIVAAGSGLVLLRTLAGRDRRDEERPVTDPDTTWWYGHDRSS